MELLARAVDLLLRTKSNRPLPEPSHVRRVLVIKPCCLGDVLMATPTLRALSQFLPGAKIDVLTREWCRPALQGNPCVSEILGYPTRLSIGAMLRLVIRLRLRHYDIGVGLDRSPLVNLLLRLAGIPERIGVDNRGRGIGLTRRISPQPEQHETELYLNVVGTLGVPSVGLHPEFHVADAHRRRASTLLAKADGPVVVIHPGGAINPGTEMLSKRWPATSFGMLASDLVRQTGASIVLVGAASDATAAQITKDFTDAVVTDLCGQLSLAELAAVCQQADLYVGNDSGTSHLASAVGTPTVTIFGPTDPAHYRPLGPRAVVCAPNKEWRTAHPTDLRQFEPSGELADINRVSVDQVMDVCLELLAGQSNENHR